MQRWLVKIDDHDPECGTAYVDTARIPGLAEALEHAQTGLANILGPAAGGGWRRRWPQEEARGGGVDAGRVDDLRFEAEHAATLALLAALPRTLTAVARSVYPTFRAFAQVRCSFLTASVHEPWHADVACGLRLSQLRCTQPTWSA